jgi:hypothetical protein
MPRTTFDPADQNTVGRMVSLALVAQTRTPLGSIQPSYGSGVYAIYYEGNHPLYRAISGSETPIYVGKADPATGSASNAREQGPKLTGRLREHAATIRVVERFGEENNLEPPLHPIRLQDFTCRMLVCATNAQLAAERHLIRTFWPLWNSDTKACWGMSKHGDSTKTRKNKRSPWDVVHPGRPNAVDAEIEDKLTPAEIADRIEKVIARTPARKDHAALVEEMLSEFRQDLDISIEEAQPALAALSGPDTDERQPELGLES